MGDRVYRCLVGGHPPGGRPLPGMHKAPYSWRVSAGYPPVIVPSAPTGRADPSNSHQYFAGNFSDPQTSAKNVAISYATSCTQSPGTPGSLFTCCVSQIRPQFLLSPT